jgi:NADH:ubiquinone reductase (H+-translocating)
MPKVLIVGGGFAGLGCAQRLAKHDDVEVTLVDRNNYHQFQPLLYQVATSQISGADVSQSLREVFAGESNVDVRLAEITRVDTKTRTVFTSEGESWSADVLVLAGGSRPNFFATPGAAEHAFPLYSLSDAQRLRSRILGLLEQADRDPSLVDRGALNFVVVGGGPTGVEVAGALGDMVTTTIPAEYRNIDPASARVRLVDLGDALLKAFSDKAHGYARRALEEKGVEIRLETGVKEIGSGHVVLSDGTTLATRCVIWGGGIKATEVAGDCGISPGRGGRLGVESDLTVAGNPNVYVIGDMANITGADGEALPQLGSVAMQSGAAAADNILATFAGKDRKPFSYRDKGILAMIGRHAAIAELGKKHHEIHGEFAHAAWLGVHAALLTGTRSKIHSVVEWMWDSFTKSGGAQILDRPDVAEIDWDDDPVVAELTSTPERTAHDPGR